MQISGAPSVGLLPVLRLALQVLGTLAFLNPSLRFFHSTRLLLRLHSGVWKVVLPKKAVASVDFICYLSSLRLLLYAGHHLGSAAHFARPAVRAFGRWAAVLTSYVHSVGNLVTREKGNMWHLCHYFSFPGLWPTSPIYHQIFFLLSPD